MSKSKLIKRVWCTDCTDKNPPIIRKADCLIPARQKHYDLSDDKASIDMRVTGICNGCLEDKNTFQKSNTEPVNPDHKHIVYKNA